MGLETLLVKARRDREGRNGLTLIDQLRWSVATHERYSSVRRRLLKAESGKVPIAAREGHRGLETVVAIRKLGLGRR